MNSRIQPFTGNPVTDAQERFIPGSIAAMEEGKLNFRKRSGVAM